jgi:hypothetical protein
MTNMTNKEAQELKKSFQKGIEAIKAGAPSCCGACPKGDFLEQNIADFAVRAAKDLGFETYGFMNFPRPKRIAILTKAIELVDKDFPPPEVPAVEYKYLKRGNLIKDGDEFLNSNGEWCLSHRVGKRVTQYCATMKALRRKVEVKSVKEEPKNTNTYTAMYVYETLQRILKTNNHVLLTVEELVAKNKELQAKLEAVRAAVQ